MTVIDFAYHVEGMGPTERYEYTSTSAAVDFRIYDDSEIGHTRLELTEANGITSRRRVDFIEIAVPQPHVSVLLVVRWRSGSTDESIYESGDPQLYEIKDRVAKLSNYLLPVPSQTYASYEWELKAGTPGFQLTVKVKRK